MNRLLIRLATMATAGGLLLLKPAAAQVSPTTPNAGRVRITQGPEIEFARGFLTIVRWATDNPGGSPVHYGVVHYGTNPKRLDQTAKSPVRLNPRHSSTLFRVRVEGLKPGITYYYTVESEGANGTSDGVKSAIRQFAIEQP